MDAQKIEDEVAYIVGIATDQNMGVDDLTTVIREVLQTLASKEAELVRLKAALTEILDPNCIRTSDSFKMIARRALTQPTE